MADNEETEETETETEETTDDGASNWDRMEALIDKSLEKHVGNIDDKIKGALKAWRPAVSKNSNASQPKKETTPEKETEETPDRSKKERKTGIFSNFFNGL